MNVPDAPDSDDEPQEQAYSVIMVTQKPKNFSQRSMNAIHVEYHRYDHTDRIQQFKFQKQKCPKFTFFPPNSAVIFPISFTIGL